MTTIAYNTAVKFAEKWYKTVLIDLDPQCNISRLALWADSEILLQNEDNIYWELSAEWQMKSKAIFNLIPWEDFPSVTGTRENLEISKVQFEKLTENIISILEKY